MATSIDPIGIFDSGIGGVSVANAIVDLLPNESFLYFGDTARLPYGIKTHQKIRQYSIEVAQFLISKGIKALVIACNTASAAALDTLRKKWPNLPIIGMEPAIKPAVAFSNSQVVGILATQGTFQSERYLKLTGKYASNIKVLEDPCLGLVELIEAGKGSDHETKQLLEKVLQPMLSQRADTFVLGCTHYPFVESLIRSIIGEKKKIINPAPAIARQLKKRLEENKLLRVDGLPRYHFFFSGTHPSTGILLSKLFSKSYSITEGVWGTDMAEPPTMA